MPLRHSSLSSATMWRGMLPVASGASADSLRYAVFFALWIYFLPIGCGTGSAPHRPRDQVFADRRVIAELHQKTGHITVDRPPEPDCIDHSDRGFEVF
jgi:hypothetical protein